MDYGKRVCVGCGTSFEAVVHNKKFCTEQCRNKFTGKNGDPLEYFNCSFCGKKTKKTIHNKEFCKDQCRTDSHEFNAIKKCMNDFETLKNFYINSCFTDYDIDLDRRKKDIDKKICNNKNISPEARIKLYTEFGVAIMEKV